MHSDDDKEKLSLKDVLRNILEEARMILPGIQALFGFQLIAVFNNRFTELSSVSKSLHMTALLLTICAIGCLMAPASYHRQVDRSSVSGHFLRFASGLLCLGMAPLLLSITLDAFVVCDLITGNPATAFAASFSCFVLLFGLWYAVPYLRKKAVASEKSNVLQL